MFMKKNLVLALLLLVSVGCAVEATAQSKKHHKKKTSKKEQTTTTTEPAPAPAEGPTAAPEPAVPAVAEDTGVSTPDMVASSDSMAWDKITLDTSEAPKDGFYKASTLKGAKPFPFPKESINDIKFYKRIWREINTTDSENKIFAVPGETLMQLIMDALKRGKLIAYGDESFKTKLTYRQVMAKFRDSIVVPILDSTGEQTGSKTVLTDFNPDSVTRYEIKEEIFFDKIRGLVVTKIIGLAPLQAKKNSVGVYLGDVHPFYLNFDQCRRLFAAREVMDPQRDIYNISFDDVFIQRAFKSMIVKESNPADLRIKDKYPDEALQKKEAARIEREIARYKRNLWKY